MVGAFAGAKLAVFLSGAVQLALLAVVMLAAAGVDAARQRGADGAAETPAPPSAWRCSSRSRSRVGVLTGLVGIGGGFLVVPALVLLARVPMRQAVGTSLLVIAMNSASGFAGLLGTVDFDWGFLARLHRRRRRRRARRHGARRPRPAGRPQARRSPCSCSRWAASSSTRTATRSARRRGSSSSPPRRPPRPQSSDRLTTLLRGTRHVLPALLRQASSRRRAT